MSIEKPSQGNPIPSWWHEVFRVSSPGTLYNNHKFVSYDLKYEGSTFTTASLTAYDPELDLPEGIYLLTKLKESQKDQFDYFLLVCTTIMGDNLFLRAIKDNMEISWPKKNQDLKDRHMELLNEAKIKGKFVKTDEEGNAIFSLHPKSNS